MIRWIAAVILVSLVAGCQSDPFRKSSDELTPPAADGTYEAPILPEPGLPMSTDSRFADVPLPTGVKEDLERTYVYESKTLQIGRMVYTTKSSVNELAQFYIREMPSADWKLESVLQADGAEMVFTKPAKRVNVSIRDQGFGKGRLLIVQLTPVEQ